MIPVLMFADSFQALPCPTSDQADKKAWVILPLVQEEVQTAQALDHAQEPQPSPSP